MSSDAMTTTTTTISTTLRRSRQVLNTDFQLVASIPLTHWGCPIFEDRKIPPPILSTKTEYIRCDYGLLTEWNLYRGRKFVRFLYGNVFEQPTNGTRTRAMGTHWARRCGSMLRKIPSKSVGDGDGNANRSRRARRAACRILINNVSGTAVCTYVGYRQRAQAWGAQCTQCWGRRRPTTMRFFIHVYEKKIALTVFSPSPPRVATRKK